MAAKTNVKDIPVANDKLVRDTALETREEEKYIEDITKFLGNFIGETIKKGMMEGVMIPGFGKFRPKEKLIVAKYKKLAAKRNGTDIFYRALTGKPIIRPKKNKDETI